MFRTALLAALCGLLAACGDPLAGVARISDVDLSDSDPAAAALPTAEEIEREGYFGTQAATGDGAVTVAAAVPAEDAAKPERPRGLLGLFRRGGSKTDPEAEAIAAAMIDVDAPAVGTDPSVVETPAQDATVEVAAHDVEPAPAQARRGLFGRLLPAAKTAKQEAPRTGPDARDVTPGTLLPFGEVARACDARGGDLGRKVEKAPANGYVLYDTNPNSGGPRTFYITGFDDGCPRQLTAANVILGSASRYEQFRYGPTGVDLPVGETDKAYEDIKWKVCSAGRGRPCGSQMRKMDRSTFFVSAYASFSNARTWKEMLIHDGAVLATAVKTNG